MSQQTARGRDAYARLEPVLQLGKRVAASVPERLQTALLRGTRTWGSTPSRGLRYVLLAALADECGSLVDVRHTVELLGMEQARLGSRISVHPFCYIDATGGLTIGDDVSIAHGTSILTTEHNYSSTLTPIRDQGVSSDPVIIENNVWIGAGVRILAGVTVGTGSIVAAGAVVTKDVEPNSIVAGIPAVTLKFRR